MPRPLLPPRGVFVPASILYDKTITSAVRDTWAQLRGLAWGQLETPPLSMTQLEELLGKSQSTLYGHMTILRARSALRWRSARDGTLIVSFEDLENIQDSENLEKLDSLTLPKLAKRVKGVKDSVSPTFQNSGKSKGKETIPENILRPFVNTLSDVTGLDRGLNYGRLAKEAKDLHKAGYTAQQVAIVYSKGGAWYVHDWRGQKGNKPGVGQIRQTVAELLEKKDLPASNNGLSEEPAGFAGLRAWLAEQEESDVE